MSKSALTLSAAGAAALLAAQTFVTPVAPETSQAALRGAPNTPSTPSGASTTSPLVTTAASAALLAIAGRAASRAKTTRNAEAKPFAGGLIGGESAFAGQDFNFDPLGLSVKCEKYLPWFREAELKHGRIAMLAFVGLVVPEFARIPGPEACYGAKGIVEAHNACAGDPLPGRSNSM
eukprot:Skav218662  [mRNA]  locus=scaffold365:858892:859997:- [translate_table: standard]